MIGRYRVEGLLGRGGFGCVFLAYDDQLQRQVAIKFPHAELVTGAEDADAYLAEARTVARLDHPNIVPVHDVGGSDEFPCYVVSKYIEGGNLAQRMAASRLSQVEAVQLIATVAEALHYAHTRGVIHRDIKPGNILVDVRGTPYVADFGLALRDVELGKGPRFAGTPLYMSPEQARGEGHRVDGRSDIFSLGVVLYELLVGQKPFVADTQGELLELIAAYEPRPPRQLVDSIPRELERICLRALAKRASERYTTAKDMADDLRHFLAKHAAAGRPDAAVKTLAADASTSGAATTIPHAADTTPTDSDVLKIVPKGLRSFDDGDADFFLELLPGPRDRDGLPESIRFWKARIEETDADETFAVGLMYGPSGCGKSSLVKAGLLPRLADHVIAVYVESTAEDTESRLLAGLRKRCRGLPINLNLTESLAALRRGEGLPAGKKVVLVLDQFEQWLHARGEEQESELVQALRQCDGGNVQCVVMVRDDFWMAATRFMRELEIRLLEGQNSAAVDLFDLDHACTVLAAFGRAFGRLPADPVEVADEQRQFLEQAVAGLAEEGKVVCVRLALFAEMMKGKPWTPPTLKQVGGTAGVGMIFLDETFSASTAPLEHRYHQRASRAVLQALLPAAGTNIKGHMRSREELLEASGYGQRPREFEELIQMLDGELRLITPTDPAGLDDESGAEATPGQKHYQLTHDYLVPSLREWLTSKQNETWRGRAELRLAERASQWATRRDTRSLPSLVEYVSIVCGVPGKKRTAGQQEMMRAARRHHGLRWGSALAVLLAVAVGLQWWVAGVRAENRRKTADAAVNALLRASGPKVEGAMEDIRPLRDLALPRLQQKFADEKLRPDYRLNAAYGLLDLGHVNEEVLGFVVSQIGGVSSQEFANLETAVRFGGAEAKQILAQETQATSDLKTKCRLAVLLWHLGDESELAKLADPPTDPNTHMIDPATRTTLIHEVFPAWHGEISPVATRLKKTQSPSLRAALCLALGLTPEDRLPSHDRERLKPVLIELHRSAPDGGTHSAAGWTLRQWNVPLKDEPPPRPCAWRVNSLGMTLISIPAGSFTMGSTEGDSGEKPVHRVMLTKGFWLSDREVTVEQFQNFATDKEYFKQYPEEEPKGWVEEFEESVSRTDDCPANNASWWDAIFYCNWVSRKEGKQPCYKRENDDSWVLDPAGTGYRLPTEAEWEYACRARARSEYCYGDADQLLRDYAVYSASRSSPTRNKLPNAWGLFDMHGNMWEWCNDWYGEYKASPERDPPGLSKGSLRVSRGGSRGFGAAYCRAPARLRLAPGFRVDDLGFRLAAVQSGK